jgi:putative acetyltransferase
MPFTILPGDFSDSRVLALLRQHLSENHAVTPAGSVHALDLSGLNAPEISFFAAFEGENLMGMGALKRLNAQEGEIKSMRTVDAAKRRGVAQAILMHLLALARSQGLARLFLETGSFAYFAPARRLYARNGFVECPPFAGYQPDPNSTFMRLELI